MKLRRRHDAAGAGAGPSLDPGELRPSRRHLFSPLTRRILIVNSLALAVLVVGLLYLGQYRQRLIEAELAALRVQAEIFAGALGEGAIGTRPTGEQFILPDVARPMLRRLVSPTRTRALVFGKDGAAVADSRLLAGQGGTVEVEALPPPEETGRVTSIVISVYDFLLSFVPSRDRNPRFPEGEITDATQIAEMRRALDGEAGTMRWSTAGGGLTLGAVAPVQRFKRVLGAVLLTAEADEIEAAVRDVRFDILKVFAVALAVTVLLSLYLAGTIARPVRRLAAAADNVTRGQGHAADIPDFTHRRDEIGALSESLRTMTETLWQRMVANESFAADVAHEIKNPLTSLRSAVETVSRVRDPEQQQTLMAIIQDDVKRLDRLISDISDASRLDAELAREEMEVIDIGRVLAALVQVHETTRRDDERASIGYASDGAGELLVRGSEGRLVQVFQNLLTNAQSFTPPAGHITVSARRNGRSIEITVDDEGPGIPVDSLESIFERFYSERPEGETFGRHSGLGLSISRQIVDAHGGAIHAENRFDENGRRCGARFVVSLPGHGT